MKVNREGVWEFFQRINKCPLFDQVQEFFRVVVTDSDVCRVQLLLSSYLYGCCKSRTQIGRRCRKVMSPETKTQNIVSSAS